MREVYHGVIACLGLRGGPGETADPSASLGMTKGRVAPPSSWRWLGLRAGVVHTHHLPQR
jgi:hypothetical protein